jgi:hypothetical protein
MQTELAAGDHEKAATATGAVGPVGSQFKMKEQAFHRGLKSQES